MKRFKVNPRKDKKKFVNTAVRTKAVNLPKKGYRGGIRF